MIICSTKFLRVNKFIKNFHSQIIVWNEFQLNFKHKTGHYHFSKNSTENFVFANFEENF